MKPSSWARYQSVLAVSLIAILGWSSLAGAQTPPDQPESESLKSSYHITTNNPDARLEVLNERLLKTGEYDTDDDEVWLPACPLPCNRELDARLRYRIGGPGVKKSDLFQLNPENTELHAHAGSKASRVWGIVLTPIGGFGIFTGTLAWFAADYQLEKDPSDADGKEKRIYAVTFWALGAAALATGIVLIATNSSSISKQKPTTRTAWQAPSSFLSLGSGVWLSPSGVHF
jgi:hypothetical protein